MLDKREGVGRAWDFRGEIDNSQVAQKELNMWQTNSCWANQEQWGRAREQTGFAKFFSCLT